MHLTVLIVDDHADAREALLARLPQVDGVTAVGAVDTLAAALEAVRRLRPGVVVCDVRLRGEDGVALVRELRSAPDPPAVIVHTSFLLESERAQLRQAGVADIVLKEAGLGALIEALRRLRGTASPPK